MIKTRLCDLLGIEYPIIQGGMAWVSTAELAAAVSEAGALGIIAAGNLTAEEVRKEIRKAKELTQKPFGVNALLLSPFIEEVMAVIIEEGVEVVATGAGNPGKYIPGLKEKGIKIIPLVASVALAKRLERQGVDAVVAEGMESGGHIGEVTTMALVPQIAQALKIPVIAAGGIADGRGIVAALALGAQGIQMGSRFVCSVECTAHSAFKEFYLKAKDRDTVVTGYSTGHPVRILRNKLSREFERLERDGASPEELNKLGEGKLKAAAVDGDIEYGSVMAGQIVGLIEDILPVKEIIQKLTQEAGEIIKSLPQNLIKT
ncbi:MAG: 2-nitropropane dioxygenase [Nitrospinae bacterium RIFCSPLOWO2_12_FULL_45_22]|nr:MAG: 2-nitropropane dioxygenase [Nitrospinae bacterium RIFCSPLOWO2_12_FULL_45_22]